MNITGLPACFGLTFQGLYPKLGLMLHEEGSRLKAAGTMPYFALVRPKVRKGFLLPAPGMSGSLLASICSRCMLHLQKPLSIQKRQFRPLIQ